MARRARRWGLGLAVLAVLGAAGWASGVFDRVAYFAAKNSPAAAWQKLREDGVAETVQVLLDKLLDEDNAPTLRYALADPASWPPVESAAERAALPEVKTIPALPAAEQRASTGHAPDATQWTRGHGSEFSDKFSAHRQITPDNVARLELAWTYRTGAPLGDAGQIGLTSQTQPLYAGGRLFVTDTVGHLIALDPARGTELWRLKLPMPVARRGLLWQPHADFAQSRLFVPAGDGVWAVDPVKGQVLTGFGEGGRVGGRLSLIAPSLVGDTLVIATIAPSVEGFDAATGQRRWRRKLLERLERGAGRYVYGAAPWGGMSSDPRRGLVFVATGNPRPQLVGTSRPGDNRHSASVVAIDAKSGEIRWSHQEVAHDLWDLDVPAPPVLATITREGRRVDVLAAVTKVGHVIVLDRDTGRPVFDYRLRRAPTSTLPGERTAPYQPDLQTPAPFTKTEFTEADITDLTPEATAYVRHKLRDARWGWFQPPVLGGTVAAFGLQGGAEWPGAAVDPASGTLFVPSNQIPWLIRVALGDTKASVAEAARVPGHDLYMAQCASCHRDDRRGYWEGEREGDTYHPALQGITFLRPRERLLSTAEFERAHRYAKRGGALPTPGTDELRTLVDYFAALDAVADRERRFIHDAYWQLLLDDRGHPGSKPPWGHLTAIDLNTGAQRWQVPFGRYDDLQQGGAPVRGQRNTGGAIVTASGLLFATGTVDDRLFAHAAADGRELWSAKLPAAGSAPPGTFVHEGVQYLVVVAGGGAHVGFSGRSDQVLAYRLPAAAR